MILENVKFALGSLWSNKARALLTMLGVIIGVGSVITLISIGEGIRSEFSNQIESIGSNLIIVASGDVGISNDDKEENPNVIYTQPQSSGGFGSMASSINPTLLQEDVDDIKNNIQGLTGVSGMSISGAIPYYDNKRIIGPMVFAMEPDGFNLFQGEEFGMLAGDYFKEDINQREIVIGNITKDGIFGTNRDPDEVIGKKIKLFDEDFTIIGIFKEEESSSSSLISGGGMFSDTIVLPLTTNQELSDSTKFYRIMVNTENPDKVDDIKSQMQGILKENHGSQDDFTVFTEEEILGIFNDFFGILTSAVSGIAAISLIVGGIGIMNIMLVAVSERTREIGVRKSIGATFNNVLGQFIIEAIILSLLGGILGVLFAYSAGWGIEKYANLPTSITYDAMLLAFGISFIVGLVFGIAPAIKAARKSPIEALRYE